MEICHCRTMACPLRSSGHTAFEGRAQSRSFLCNTEGPDKLRRKLQHHPLHSSFTAALPKPAGAGSPARSETGAHDRARSEAGESGPRGGFEAVSAAGSEPVQAPVQTRFSVMEAIPLARVMHHAESAQASAEA